MSKGNLYQVCQPCPHTCTDEPCEAILQLKVLAQATELTAEEFIFNIREQVREAVG